MKCLTWALRPAEKEICPHGSFGLTHSWTFNWQLGCTSRHTENCLRDAELVLTYRELQMSSLCLKKASQQDAPYFITMSMTCALSCATKLTWKKLFWNAVEGRKNTPVTSDIPSVLNSTVTAKGQQVSIGWDELSPRRQTKAEVWPNAVHTDGRGVSASSAPTVDPGTWAVGICCCWWRWEANVSPALAQFRFSCPTPTWSELSCQSPWSRGSNNPVNVWARDNKDAEKSKLGFGFRLILSPPSLCTVCDSLAVTGVSTWALVG